VKLLRAIVFLVLVGSCAVASADGFTAPTFTKPGHLGANRIDFSTVYTGTPFHYQLQIEWREKLDGVWTAYGGSRFSGTSQTETDKDMEFNFGPYDPGEGYQMRWREIHFMTAGAWNELAEQLEAPPSPPAAPSDLAALTVSSSEIDLDWTDNATDETAVEVWMSEDGGAYALADTLATNATTYSASGLSPATDYAFKVRAVNGDGESAYSNIATATTDSPAVAAPTSFTATALSSSRIKLQWVDNSDSGDPDQETSFVIQHRADAMGTWATLTTTAADVEQFEHTGLLVGSHHEYRIRAERSLPESIGDWIGPQEATTLGNSAEYEGSQPDGGFSRKVGGDIQTTERAMEVIWVKNQAQMSGGPHAMASTLKQNLVKCGNMQFQLQAAIRYAEDVTPMSTEFTGGKIYTYNITVARNGYVAVSSTFNSNYGSNPGDTSPDSTQWNVGSDKNAKDGLAPLVLKKWIDDGMWVTDREQYAPYPTQYTPAIMDEWDRYLLQHKALAQGLYNTMIGEAFDWQARIPRCPGEDLDAYDLGTGTGGGGSTTFDYTSSVPAPDPPSSLPANREELDKLKVLPTIDFEAEVSSTTTINGSGWWPGWSSGTSWTIDWKHPGGPGFWTETMDTWRIVFRNVALFIVWFIVGQQCILTLRQY
jgi:hypothetical protein